MLRTLFTMLLLGTTLFAIPSISQLKTAIKADPSLLDSPQAKLMMQEQGISKVDIQKKLAKEEKLTTKSIESVDVENRIDILDANETKSRPSMLKSVNPFKYQTRSEIRKILNERQQILVNKKLSRYSDRFYANKNMIDSASLPTPENYTISTGDRIDIHVYGDRDEKLSLEVNNDGEIELQYIGPVRVGGMSYKELKTYLTRELKQHFKLSSFKISISKYSSIQVTLIGDVKYPGIYNLSSFSTAKDLFIVSKGVRDTASVRNIDIKRNGKTIAKLDFYDLLFRGKSVGTTLLKHGDIVVVKKADTLVSIDGYVNNAAKFELKKGETLAKLIEYAGGMKANASKRHIKIDRYSDNIVFETFHINYRKAKKFRMRDGDRVYIYQLDSTAQSSVSLYGNIIRPGAYPLPKERTLTTFLNQQLKYGSKHFFLPETYFEYGLIKRYTDALNYKIHSFNLKDVLDAKEKVSLEPQDEIYIFSKNDLQSSSYITTSGSLFINAGKLRYFEGMTIRDAIHASGVDGIVDDMVRVTTINTPDRMPKTTFYSLKKDANIILSPYDEVEIYDYYQTHRLEPVSIKGEVVNPTTVFYEKDMTLQKILDASGGFTTMAYLKQIEIVRYYIDAESNRKKKIDVLNLSDIDPKKYILEPYDEVTIYKIPNWGEKQVVTLSGEVKFPGKYTISNGEKLASVIARAGGYTKDAFIQGAVFTRDSIKRQQIDQYNHSLAKIKRELALYNAMPANAKRAATSVGATSTLNDVILEAKKYQPIGRVSVTLDKDLDFFKESPFNLVLKDKDTLTIPNQIDTVTVFGEVFNPTSFVYNEVLSSEDYIEMASGLSRAADEGSIYIIHANGMSEPLNAGWFSANAEIKKGDTIVVPVYIKEINTLEIWDSVSRVLASFAVTAAALSTLGVI